MLVDQRGIGITRLDHVVDRRQFLQIERDGRGDIFGFGSGRRHAHRDQFADMTHLPSCQHRLFGYLESG